MPTFVYLKEKNSMKVLFELILLVLELKNYVFSDKPAFHEPLN